MKNDPYKVKCPHCNEKTSKVSLGVSTTTMGFAHVFDGNGKQVSHDPNISTYGFRCAKCNNIYSVKKQYGKITEVTKTGVYAV